MKPFEGKKGLIIGVANDRSIAWAIAKEIMEQGGVCGFTHLPDRVDDERQRNRRRVSQLTEDYPDNAKFLIPLDVQNDENIQSVMKSTEEQFGKIDFLLHSVAFADRKDMDISAYSLLAVSKFARPILNPGASICAMTYFGGEKIVPGYNVMGICKAALEAVVRYLAYDLGPSSIRVNAISAGPLRTLAGSAAGVDEMLKLYEYMAPLARNVTHQEVGRSGAFLLSPLSDGITGEILHVDGGYNAMGSPGRLLDRLK
jgi:enoyl-[acyl-carrier protein] reductase I